MAGCVSSTHHRGVVARYEQERKACQAEQSTARAQFQAQRKKEKAQRDELQRQAQRRDQTMGELQVQLDQTRQELSALQAEQAELLHQRSGLRLKAQELAASYARMLAQTKSEIARAQEREKLDLDLAVLLEQGSLKIEAEGAHTVLLLAMDPIFSLGEAGLNATGLTQLQKVAQALRATYAPGKIWIQVQGHTDNIPKRTATIRNNWELSAARALAVVSQFIEAGFDPECLQAAAFGSFRPIADNASRKGRAQNRRISIVISPRDPDLASPPHH